MIVSLAATTWVRAPAEIARFGVDFVDATTREVLNDPRVIEAYLGGQAA